MESLVDRIRLAARRGVAGPEDVTADSIARGELPPVPEPVGPPNLPVRPLPAAAGPSHVPTFPLEEVAGMLPRARRKITVGDKVPGMLRPLLRNQGGFNHLLLETLGRLVEVNRQLQRQNQDLQGRFTAMQGWMDAVARTSGQQHDWMLAVQNRLRGLPPERLVRLEERLAQLATEHVRLPPVA